MASGRPILYFCHIHPNRLSGVYPKLKAVLRLASINDRRVNSLESDETFVG